MRLTTLTSAALIAAASWTPAAAQLTEFVLFGEPNPEGIDVASERRHVHPITSPYTHEDSFITTDVRAWYLYHDFPNSSVLDGGHAQVYAVQLRVALTDQLQFVAYKDGYTDFDTGLLNDDGWNDVAAGIKWAFLQDWEKDLHAAVGIGYEIGVGDDDVLQGDDALRFWASIDKGFDRLHMGATVNFLIPTGGEDTLGDADQLYWHARADYWVCKWFSPVLEFNGYHVLDDGDNVPLNISGVDVAILGGGEDVVTVGFGGEVRPIDNVALRAAYETPLTDNEDLFGYRWTLSAILSF